MSFAASRRCATPARSSASTVVGSAIDPTPGHPKPATVWGAWVLSLVRQLCTHQLCQLCRHVLERDGEGLRQAERLILGRPCRNRPLAPHGALEQDAPLIVQ